MMRVTPSSNLQCDAVGSWLSCLAVSDVIDVEHVVDVVVLQHDVLAAGSAAASPLVSIVYREVPK